jgi:hypothetical protein
MTKYFKLIYALPVLALLSCRKDGPCVTGNSNFVTENRTIGTFDGVSADGSLDVFITEDSVESIKVEAESNIMPLVKTQVISGKLNIYTSGCIRKMKTIKVWVGVKNINSISFNGSGSLQTLDTLHSSSLSAKLNGSGDFDLLANVESTSISLNGSGNIKVQGKGDKADFNISGSGNMHAFEFPVVSASAKISGSGNMEINVIDSLDVNISGSGNVYYKGRPRTTIHTSGSGQVEAR